MTLSKESCAFLDEGMARIDDIEVRTHGRRRKIDRDNLPFPSFHKDDGHEEESTGVATGLEEGRFGVMTRPIMLAKGTVEGAQWTGCTTGIALSMLESGMVDAVVCIASDTTDTEDGPGTDGKGWSQPMPILARTAKDVLRGRGVKPALAPSLRVLDEIQADESIKKLLFCGVGCAVQGTLWTIVIYRWYMAYSYTIFRS